MEYVDEAGPGFVWVKIGDQTFRISRLRYEDHLEGLSGSNTKEATPLVEASAQLKEEVPPAAREIVGTQKAAPSQSAERVAAPSDSFETFPAGEFAPPYLAAGTGQLYNLFEGKLEGKGAEFKDNFLFTDEGVIPLSAEAQRIAERYAVGQDDRANFMFNLQGDSSWNYGGTDVPIFERWPGKELKLPPGVVQGIPEGEDPGDYISVGKTQAEGGAVLPKGDPYLYVKLLPAPTRPVAVPEQVIQQAVVVEEEEEEEPIATPVVKRRPPKPEEIWEYVVDDPYQGEDAPPGIYDSDYDSFQDNPVSAETERNKPERYKDPLFGPNLLASIAAGLSDVDLSGASYGLPRYDQGVYASRQLGPSVQNLFRGR